MRDADSDSSANDRWDPPRVHSAHQEGGPRNSSVVASNVRRDPEVVEERNAPRSNGGRNKGMMIQ